MKAAFSLLELLIVIVIIGVVYTLAITNLKNVGENSELLPSFKNLKEYLASYKENNLQTVQMICLDTCSECNILLDGKKIKTIKSFFDTTVQSYRYDFLTGVTELKNDVYFDEKNVQKDVCFSFSLYPNKVAQQIIIQYKNKIYDYTNYFIPTQEYNSMAALIDTKESLIYRVTQ